MSTEGRAPPADDPGCADAAAGWLGAYVHIPFCRRVCPYCDFAVVAGHEDLHERYVAAVMREIALWPEARPVDALFIGGGTPSQIAPAALGRIVGAVAAGPGLAPGAEVTMEANPEDWTPAAAAGFAAAGVTRVSLGVQSFDGSVLAALGRVHGPGEAVAAAAAATDAGLEVNIDLIFGTPGESAASWAASVDRALATGARHLSTYALTVERGTPLSRAVAAGAPGPDPDDQADKWELAAARAGAAGLRRYEISNFAADGAACRYNLVTWAQGEYLAAGVGAHRHVGAERSWNVRRLDRYLEAVEAGRSAVSGSERLDAWGRERERLILGLRRAAGVVPGAAGQCLLASPGGRRLREAGAVGLVGGRLVASRPLLGDEIARTVLALDRGEC